MYYDNVIGFNIKCDISIINLWTLYVDLKLVVKYMQSQ